MDGLAAPTSPAAVGVPGQQAALAVVAVQPAHGHGHLHHPARRAHVQHRLRERSRGAERGGTLPRHRRRSVWHLSEEMFPQLQSLRHRVGDPTSRAARSPGSAAARSLLPVVAGQAAILPPAARGIKKFAASVVASGTEQQIPPKPSQGLLPGLGAGIELSVPASAAVVNAGAWPGRHPPSRGPGSWTGWAPSWRRPGSP